MSISDIKKRAVMKTIVAYGAATVFCFVFQLIYGKFSHGVSSSYMSLAFLIPFFGGVLSIAGICLLSCKSGEIFCSLTGGAVIWFTLGSIFKGVLEIYGTTNHLTAVFAIVGSVQIAAAFVLAGLKNNRAQMN